MKRTGVLALMQQHDYTEPGAREALGQLLADTPAGVTEGRPVIRLHGSITVEYLGTGKGYQVTDSDAPVDFSAHYTVRSQPGVAWRVLRYATEWTEESWTLACDDPAHRYDYDESSPDDPDSHGLTCYVYSEAEEIDNPSKVLAVMVGDDREEVIDTDDLELIPEDGFCRSCGQTGCACNVHE
jgi:hypothetical protein